MPAANRVPAAFGKGGTNATVTDADIVLGVIDPQHFAEGRLQIDPQAAKAALEQSVGATMGLDAMRCAEGVSRIVDEAMASAARMHAVESGKDLGRRCMIAFGGNGPLHATRVARRAYVDRIVVPRDPGVGSAIGFLHAPVSFELVRSHYTTLDALDVEAINGLLSEMQGESESVVRSGARDTPLNTKRAAFMRYHGQGHEIEIGLPDQPLQSGHLAMLRRAFETEYARQFTRAVPGMTIEILNWAVQVSTPDRKSKPLGDLPASVEALPCGTLPVLCDVTGEICHAAVHLRDELVAGSLLSGPALIVEPQTTTFVSRDFCAQIDAGGNIVLTRQHGESKA